MQADILDALRRGANDEALDMARKAVVADSQDPQAYHLLAMALRASGDQNAALASIDRAIALAPDDAEFHFHRAGYLIGRQQIDDAQAALAQSVQLDPNQFGAYVMQAQLALGRGDLDEADRVAKLAARVAPEHPWTTMIEGSVALRRGDSDRALSLLSSAAEAAPDDPQVRHALGFAYLQKGHHAFAEQAFRGVLETTPDATALHGLIAELLARQGRYDEAASELAPLLDDPRWQGPVMQRFAGELELLAGRHEQALPLLRGALAARPDDPRTLTAMTEAWRRSGDYEDARNSLDAALATSPRSIALWRARLLFTRPSGDDPAAVIERWLAAMPGEIMPLEAKMDLLARAGDASGADDVAGRIIELQPGHTHAEMRLLDQMIERDPAAAVAHLQVLLSQSDSEDGRHVLRTWLAMAQHRAGMRAEAVASWSKLHADVAEQRLPLPEPAAPLTQWPPLADAAADAPGVAFLVGVPGSGVESVARILTDTIASFRSDRFGPAPPDDLLQNYNTAARLQSGELDPAEVASRWRAALPARGIDNGEVIDWLLWWDNLLLTVLRVHVPQGLLLIPLRDPRDMLLDWLVYGTPAQFRFASPKSAAGWLAIQLNQVAVLHEQMLYRHELVRLDDIGDDPEAVAAALGSALDVQIPAPPPDAFDRPRLAAGRWREYATALAEPFALLTPVARRLGYPDA